MQAMRQKDQRRACGFTGIRTGVLEQALQAA